MPVYEAVVPEKIFSGISYLIIFIFFLYYIY
jgi:hypothetical protein